QLSSVISLLNTGTAPVDITLNFYPFDSGKTAPAPVKLPSLPANGSTSFNQVPTDFLGAVTVTSAGGSLAGEVTNKRNGGQLDDLSYEAVSGAVATGTSASTVNLPLLFKGYFGWNTDLAVQNAGTASADVTVTYRSADPTQ